MIFTLFTVVAVLSFSSDSSCYNIDSTKNEIGYRQPLQSSDEDKSVDITSEFHGVLVDERVDCMPEGGSQADCENKGCLWDDVEGGVPACFIDK